MKKTFYFEIDCANCAQKVQEGISKIDGVDYVATNYLTQKLTLEAKDEIFEKVLKEAKKVAKKIEPDCVIK